MLVFCLLHNIWGLVVYYANFLPLDPLSLRRKVLSILGHSLLFGSHLLKLLVARVWLRGVVSKLDWLLRVIASCRVSICWRRWRLVVLHVDTYHHMIVRISDSILQSRDNLLYRFLPYLLL